MDFKEDIENACELHAEGLNDSCYVFQLPYYSGSMKGDHHHHRILSGIIESAEKSAPKYLLGVGNLQNSEEINESLSQGIDDQELMLKSEVACLKHPNKGKILEKEDHQFPNCQSVFQSLGLNTELKYIDDLTEKNSCGLTYEHLDDQLLHKFIVHDNILTDQVNESISSSHHENNQMEYNDHFVLSTSLSKLAKKSESWRELLQINKSHGQEEEEDDDNDCDVSLNENEHLHDSHDSSLCSIPGQRHSTPIKRKVLPLEKEMILSFHDESDEDDDIEENYLDTLWTSNGTPNLPRCRVIVKSLKNFQEDLLCHSMICKMDEMNVDASLSVQSMKDDLSSNLDGTIEEPFPLIHPLINSCSDTLLASAAKMSYKDKLMEGLSGTTPTPTPTKTPPFKTKESAPTPQTKGSLLSHNLNGLMDENHNFTTNDSKKPTECLNAPNLTKSNKDAWNECKSKKSATKRAHNSGPNSRTGLDNSGNSYTFGNSSKNKGKVEKISKEVSHAAVHSLSETICTPTRKHIPPKISHSSEVTEDKRGCDDKIHSQLAKKQSRKLKKFCSLDFSELQETSDANASKMNQKWKSHDDLDNLNGSPLKADNYLMWPLVGLAVLAGFVAFCFRDKISFMIASRFPFERPPI